MNKAEWDELDEIAKNQVVWDTFPDIAPSSNDWVLSTDGGKTGFDFYDTEIEAKAAREEYEGYPTYEHAKVFHWRHCRNFTTDRNACALVLDALKEKSWFSAWVPFCIHFLLYLNNETTCKPNFEYGDMGFKNLSIYDVGGFMDRLLRADPDTICYYAVASICDGEITE